MGIENAQDFAKWSGMANAIRNIVCLNKEKSIQDNLDAAAHIARLRRNIASALAIYERENKEYLDTLKKTEKKNAGVKEAIVQIEEGSTVVKDPQGATQADVLTPEAIAELLVKALSQGATTQASTTATTARKRVK